MTLKHLSFEELSDLIDDELSEDKKKYCIAHISICEICGREYASLSKCISLVSCLKDECITIPDFSERTIMICRKREKKRLFFKAIPAIAASVIIIAGVGFIKTGIFENSGSYVAASLSGQNDTQRIIEAVSSTKGKILKISHSYIDCEFEKNSQAAIKRILCRNKIKHALIVNTGMLINPATGRMEDASYTYGNPAILDTNDNRNQNYAVIDSNKIRIRIFK